MKKNIEKIIKYLIYTTFFIPLVVMPSSFIFPFVVPKIILFRSVVALMISLYAILLAINWQEYKIRFTPLNLGLILFILSFGISTFTGVDWYHSFWDNHERMLGLFTIIHYLAYYFICGTIFKSKEEWKKALKIFLLAGSVVMILGVCQVINPNFLMNQGNNRVAGTLGNSIYMSGYGLFLLFSALLLWVEENKKSSWAWIEIVVGLLGILGVFFGGSRGALLGLVAGIVVVMLGYVVLLRGQTKLRKNISLVFFSFFILLAGLFLLRNTVLVQKIPVFGRVFSTSLSEITSGPRIIAWKIAIESWKEKPFFGWGPNNYFYAFNKYYNPQSLNYGFGETWFDNAHNIVLNTLTVQGLYGILSYLSIFVLAVIGLYKAYKRQKISIHLLVIGSSFLVAHLVQNITVFENPTSYLYFFFFLAMINSLVNMPEGKENINTNKTVGNGILLTSLSFSILFIFIFNIQPARANMVTLKALKEIVNRPSGSLVSMKTALSFNSPHIDDIRADIARSALQVLSLDSSIFPDEQKKQMFLVIYDELKKNTVLHPLDIRNQLMLGDLAQLADSLFNDNKYLLEAEKFLSNALACSPKRQQILYGLANIEGQLGKSQKAISLLQQALEENTKISDSYWRLAYFYKVFGQAEKAEEILMLAEKNNITFNEQGQKVMDLIKQK